MVLLCVGDENGVIAGDGHGVHYNGSMLIQESVPYLKKNLSDVEDETVAAFMRAVSRPQAHIVRTEAVYHDGSPLPTQCWDSGYAVDTYGYCKMILGPGYIRGLHQISYCVKEAMSIRDLSTEMGKGFSIDHLCGVTFCMNPAHVSLVTIAENTHRAQMRRAYECVIDEERLRKKQENMRKCAHRREGANLAGKGGCKLCSYVKYRTRYLISQGVATTEEQVLADVMASTKAKYVSIVAAALA